MRGREVGFRTSEEEDDDDGKNGNQILIPRRAFVVH